MTSILSVFSNVSSNDTAICETMQDIVVKGGSIHEHLETSLETAIAIIATVSALLGIFLVFFGGRFFKRLASLVSALVAFWGITYFFNTTTMSELSCELEFLVSTLGAIVIAIAVGFLIKFALFLIGAVFFGGATHFFLEAVPEVQTIGNSPTLGNRTIVYYGIVGGAGIVGGIAIRCQERQSLEACTSLMGGILISLSLMAFAHVANFDLDRFVYVITAFCFTCIVIWFQRRQRVKKKKRRRPNQNSDNN